MTGYIEEQWHCWFRQYDIQYSYSFLSSIFRFLSFCPFVLLSFGVTILSLGRRIRAFPVWAIMTFFFCLSFH